MKKRTKKIKLFWLTWGLALSVSLVLPRRSMAQFTDSKEIKKEFKVTPETRIEISNKYGKVELNTWDKDSVVIDIKVKVEEKKLSKLEKSMEEIDFDFTSSQHFLVARTTVGENRSALEKELLKFKETVLQSDGNVEINYNVWLPKTNNLRVENKFGDIFIDDYDGEVEIDLSNGNLKSHDFSGKTNITLNFADATINKIKTARLDCNYSDLYIREAGSLKIQSKSSTFEILEAKDMDIDSRRDKFRVRLADLVEADGSFSNFRFNELTDRLTLRAEYGDLDVEKTAPDFSNIYIESKSTDINLYFNAKSNFGFEITHVKSEVDLCRETTIDEKKVLDDKENKIQLIGSFNKKTEDNTKLFINATSGEINIFSE
ncbi:MAG TPA: hypothetical protein VKA38_09415 [Draconibacterium sp.]|nr:hypothetical protein [Draconibacterium sp.]